MREIISGRVVSVSADHTVQGVYVVDDGASHPALPVVEGKQDLGVISIGDLVNSIISAQNSAIEQLETYITDSPARPLRDGTAGALFGQVDRDARHLAE